MTYKKYRIKNKLTNEYLNFIKFELNDDVEFSDEKRNFICCVNEYPFINYQKGDEIEVDLTGIKGISAYNNFINSQQKIVKKTSWKYSWWQNNDYGLQQDEEEAQQLLTQEQMTLLVSAYDKKVAHKLFRNALEWAEKYCEIVHANYQIRKQIGDKNIKRQDANDPDKVKRLFSSVLFGFKTTMEIISGDKQSKQSLYDELKKEYYEWLDVAGIDVSNCPLEFKHFLFEVNEILEGRGNKLERDIENRKWDIDPNSTEYERAFSNLFSNVQNPLDSEKKEYENLKGKTQKDITITNNFGGNSKTVEQTFKQMVGKHDYQGFSFMPQKDIQTISKEQSYSSFQQRPNSVIVQNVKQNPKHWRFDEVVIDGKRKIALIQNSVLDEMVDLNSQPVYLPQRFSSQERFEIKKVLNISGDYLISDEINWIVKEVKDNPSIWKIKIFRGQICLVHDLAQGSNDEIGTLIHNKLKFSKSKWAEINEVLEINNQYQTALGKLGNKIPFEPQETPESLEIWKKELEKKLLIKIINKNDWEVRKDIVISYSSGEKKGDALVRKGVVINSQDYNQNGELVNQLGRVYRQDYFDSKEQTEINVIFMPVRQEIVDDFNQDEFTLYDIIGTGEKWFIRNSVDLSSGRVTFDPQNMYKVNDLNEAERREIGYKSEASVQNSLSVSDTPKNDNRIGTGGVVAVVAGISALAVGGAVAIKKKLTKKNKG